MKTSDKLFVICSIYVPIMIIFLFYPQINDFYTYSVPLNSFVVEKLLYSNDPEIFQKTRDMEDSTCFTTPAKNVFCYEKPRMHDGSGVSYLRNPDGIDGELHFDPVDKGVTYFTIQNMTLIHGDTAKITLADRDYSFQHPDGSIYYVEDFEYSAIIEKFDTFISHCHNYDGKEAMIIQYLGITTKDDVDYFMTWHTLISSDKGVPCDYPKIIQQSLKHDFGI